MPELTLTGMRVVYEVGARGSFTAAAGALGYTQSAVSRQVGLAEQADSINNTPINECYNHRMNPRMVQRTVVTGFLATGRAISR
jgi:hypothetical protein